jgi:hypothetical protein
MPDTIERPKRRKNVLAAERQREKLLAENTAEERSEWARGMNAAKAAKSTPDAKADRLTEVERLIDEVGAEVDADTSNHALRRELRSLGTERLKLRWGP